MEIIKQKIPFMVELVAYNSKSTDYLDTWKSHGFPRSAILRIYNSWHRVLCWNDLWNHSPSSRQGQLRIYSNSSLNKQDFHQEESGTFVSIAICIIMVWLFRFIMSTYGITRFIKHIRKMWNVFFVKPYTFMVCCRSTHFSISLDASIDMCWWVKTLLRNALYNNK